MSDEPPAAVTYLGLPISSGGAHSLGRMSRRDAYAQTMSFLRTCTEPIGPLDYSFKANEVPELGSVARLERELERRFGHATSLPADRIDDALDFLDDIDPQPTNPYGMAPIWFFATSAFRILDPATGHPLPGQDPELFHGLEYEWSVPFGTSSLHLILHNRAAIGIELCLPNADDEVLRSVVPWLQDHLPFKFSEKQWRVWTPTKTDSFKGRRMAAPGTT